MPPGKPWWKARVAAGTLIALLLDASVIGNLKLADRWTSRPAVHSIAVLPLKNLSGNPADDFFADGMTDELRGWHFVISRPGYLTPLCRVKVEQAIQEIMFGRSIGVLMIDVHCSKGEKRIRTLCR